MTQNFCAFDGRPIPAEQPESHRGFCSTVCKSAHEAGEARRASEKLRSEATQILQRDDENIVDATTPTPTTDAEMEGLLAEVLSQPGIEELETVRTFGEEGVLTNNRGLVLRLGDGTEWQLTIVRSR